MEIAFGDIKHIIIDIVLVECHCVLFHIWVSECPQTDKTSIDFRVWCARKKRPHRDFVAANIAAVNRPLSVCLDPNKTIVSTSFFRVAYGYRVLFVRTLTSEQTDRDIRKRREKMK